MKMKLMKFFGVALVATVLSASFCACSDDDDDDSSVASELIGTWIEDTNLEYEVFHIQFNSNFTGYQWVTNYGVIDENGKEAFTWKATDKTITVTIGKQSQTLDYSISGNRLTISSGGEKIYYVRE